MNLIQQYDYLFMTIFALQILSSRSFSLGSHATFMTVRSAPRSLRPSTITLFENQSSSETTSIETDINFDEFQEMNNDEMSMQISSPLKFIGPYPCLSLHFPKLATSSQRERDVSGISLDFVLDTAANTNTINAQVASELNLDSVGSALPGYNAAGAMDGGSTFLLGDCGLDLPELKREMFMSGLTASALPVASPAAAGLLGVAFLNCFQGGVKFEWSNQPKVTFYGDSNGMESELANMTRAPIEIIKDVLLPSVALKVNGKEIRALLDTGSPITVLNSAAAELAGLDVIQLPNQRDEEVQGSKKSGGFFNPFQKVMDNVKEANLLAQAAARGDVLTIAGAQGQAVQLLRTESVAKLSVRGETRDISFPENKIYVGDLPGLAALGGLNGNSSPPAAVLGMDVLAKKSSMLYRMDEVYFS